MTSTILSTLRELDCNDEEKLRLFFDDILSKIPTDDYQYLTNIVNGLIETNTMCVHIIDHSFFVHIRNIFIDQLQKSVDDFDLSHCIGQLFSQLMNHVNNENIYIIQQLFADADLTKCLIESLKNITPTSNVNLVSSIEYMIDAYQKFQEDRTAVQDDPIILTLLIPIMNFVNSAQYKSAFFQLSPQQNEFTHYQKLILVTCPKYVRTHWGQYYDEVTSVIAQEILIRSSEILEHFLPSIDDWEAPMIWGVFTLILLCQYCANEHLLPIYDVYHEKILDYVLDIVQEKELWQLANQVSKSGKRQKRAGQLFCYATLYIYTMTFLPKLRDKLRENNTAPILIRLTQADFDKTQFHAYRALAAILTDDDIKQLMNPAQITAVFIIYMKKCIEGLALTQRLENLLYSLTILMQHDRIKEEFVKQTNGILLLFRCINESQFDDTKIQLRALEILMSLTFNNEAKLLLQKNDSFVQHLRIWITLANKPNLQKVADGILWRLFPKDDKPTESKFQYDVMISYSHKHKDICHRIHKALIADKFRVWIDLERMHGAVIQAMADAIEHSRYVIICMSDSYCVSPYCRAEAQFAFEKQRDLIPLRIQTGYKPQGWLAFVISGRIYVDFIKMNFNVAYNQLVSELHHNHVSGKEIAATVLQSHVIEDEPASKNEHTVYSYPTNVLQWTPDNVRDFILDKQLNQMMPVCQQMDGQNLVELYKLCRTNSPVMLQMIRSEVLESYSKPLSINTYLTFLHEMKNIIPEDKGENSSSRFQSCTLV